MLFVQPMKVQLSPQIILYEIGFSSPRDLNTSIALPHLPSTAFGDGSHPTTRLCAGAVDFICRLHKPHSVLDVGTGTGVLARIARARGAQFIVATDIDPNALIAAEKNTSLDTYPAKIQISHAPPNSWGSRFDLVIANILEGPLRELAESLYQALTPNGILLISGFTRLQTPGLRTTFSFYGFSLLNESHLDEWALLMFQK